MSATKKRRRTGMPRIVITVPNGGLPTRSWWATCATREEFSAEARREVERMRWSKFGRAAAREHADL
jgi:hypothetical protein